MWLGTRGGSVRRSRSTGTRAAPRPAPHAGWAATNRAPAPARPPEDSAAVAAAGNSEMIDGNFVNLPSRLF